MSSVKVKKKIKVTPYSNEEEVVYRRIQHHYDVGRTLTKVLDDAWKPWVGITGISLLGLFLLIQILTTIK